ncbi:hypothetical protein F5Y03DRAFT_332319 [Xylaria venustula]|nr:hypothetical protein F5Y03DRAFT_332319 [Xylaria venustula]
MGHNVKVPFLFFFVLFFPSHRGVTEDLPPCSLYCFTLFALLPEILWTSNPELPYSRGYFLTLLFSGYGSTSQPELYFRSLLDSYIQFALSVSLSLRLQSNSPFNTISNNRQINHHSAASLSGTRYCSPGGFVCSYMPTRILF